MSETSEGVPVAYDDPEELDRRILELENSSNTQDIEALQAQVANLTRAVRYLLEKVDTPGDDENASVSWNLT